MNNFTEALGCDRVSKSLRRDILSYRATAELKAGNYEDAMADCQTLGEDFPWMPAVISLPEKLPLPWIPTRKRHRTLSRPMERTPPMIWRSRSMKRIWIKIWKQTEPDIWRLPFLLRPRTRRITVTEAAFTIIWKITAMQKRAPGSNQEG